jgi:hypothetical protein
MQFLRLAQYACLYSVEGKPGTPAHRVYEHMRMARKLLRFMGELELAHSIRREVPNLRKRWSASEAIKRLAKILQLLFKMLFFLLDHKVFLAKLGIIGDKGLSVTESRSMVCYFLQNVCGVLYNLMKMAEEIMSSKGKDEEEKDSAVEKSKKLSFDLLRCLFDCLVALYYWKAVLPAKKAGILGAVTSVMAIMQSLGFM